MEGYYLIVYGMAAVEFGSAEACDAALALIQRLATPQFAFCTPSGWQG